MNQNTINILININIYINKYKLFGRGRQGQQMWGHLTSDTSSTKWQKEAQLVQVLTQGLTLEERNCQVWVVSKRGLRISELNIRH
jgi:hypothetical protein